MRTYHRLFDCPRDAWRAWALLAAEVGAGEYPLGVLRAIAYSPDAGPDNWRRGGETACLREDSDAIEHNRRLCQRPRDADDGALKYGLGRTRVGIVGDTVRLSIADQLHDKHTNPDDHPRVVLAKWLGLERVEGRR